MRTTLIAELATAHGGDLAIAEDLIRAAADSGADYAKVQTYDLAKLNKADPQYDWLVQSHLDKRDHEHLLKLCEKMGIKFLSTPFDAGSLQMLRELGLTTFKIASSESGHGWWRQGPGEYWVSWPWGKRERVPACHDLVYSMDRIWVVAHEFTAVPLYPTPLECVSQATMLDGWSDHCEGIAACQRAIVNDAQILEAHLCLPGKSRVKPWDKTPEQMLALRRFAEDVCTMQTGVSETFRTRWSRSA